MGLVEERQEVMEKGQEKEDASADLALIGAAQRVEHYEISGYTTAKISPSNCVTALLSRCSPNHWLKRKMPISC